MRPLLVEDIGGVWEHVVSINSKQQLCTTHQITYIHIHDAVISCVMGGCMGLDEARKGLPSTLVVGYWSVVTTTQGWNEGPKRKALPYAQIWRLQRSCSLQSEIYTALRYRTESKPGITHTGLNSQGTLDHWCG